jgi:hypothetical protein
VSLVINLFAGPGAGKSTTAAGVFALLKMHGIRAELVTEYAKDIVWEGIHNRLNFQEYIFAQQLHRVKRLLGQVDVIVTDSPILLSLHYHPNLIGAPHFEPYVLGEWDSMRNRNYYIQRVKTYDPKGRRQNEFSAREVDVSLQKLLNSHNIPYEAVTGDALGINLIVEDTFNTFGESRVKYRVYGIEGGLEIS